MNKKGFTLVELLAIVILLVGIFLLMYPKITEILEKEEQKIDDIELETIYDAVDRYIDNNNDYEKTVGKEYCILYDTLDKENLIPFENTDYQNKVIRVIIGKTSNYHEFVNDRTVGEHHECIKENETPTETNGSETPTDNNEQGGKQWK